MQKIWLNVAQCGSMNYTIIMKLSYKLETSLIEALQDIHNEFASCYANLKNSSIDELRALHQYARISMIGASTRIENALLTDPEVNWLDTILAEDGRPTAFKKNEDLIINKLSKDRERSIEEVAGCRAMLMLVYENSEDFFPTKEADIRALHYELLAPYKKAKKFAGKYKIQPNSVIEHNKKTGKSRTVFQTADPGPVTVTAMHDLIKWYNEEYPISPWPIAITCEYVFRFLAIHPFQDGNGRLGRALFLLSLLNSKIETIAFVSRYLAIDRYVEKYKEEYYFTLNRCSNGKYLLNSNKYKIQYFLKFMLKVLKEAINNIEPLKIKFAKEKSLSKSANIVLDCFKNNPEIRLTSSEIMKKTGLPKRTITRSLNILVNSALIQKYGKGAGTRYQITF